MSTIDELVTLVADVQRLPYAWPAPPTSESVRENGSGTCAGKHALLREELEGSGFAVSRLMVVGRLAPGLWPDLEEIADDLLEVHECLTVETPWAGPVLVDVTWHPAAIAAGFRGTVDWMAREDMVCAVEPIQVYAVSDATFRAQKELLRSRLYSSADRARRDLVLAELARRAALLR